MRLNGNPKFTSHVLFAGCCLAILLVASMTAFCETPRRLRPGEQKIIQLPEPNLSSSVSLEKAISARRSEKQFANTPLDYAQIGQLAWAGQGITNKQLGLRAAPSAGALYPIEVYFVMSEGLFIYNPEGHSLKQISSLDMRKNLATAAMGLGPVEDAACDIVIVGSIRKVATKYGNKAQNLIHLEAGYVAQNIQLQAVAMGLASVPIGEFEPRNVAKVCELPGELEPLLIVCVGQPIVEQKPQDQSQSIIKLTKKALLVVPLAQFADAELFDTQRILTEAGVTSVVASSKIGTLQGVFGGIAASEITLDRVQVEDYDAVIFVGGPGVADYFANPTVLNIVREASARNKLIAAISSAPMILSNAGVLRGIRATGLPQQREQMKKAGAQFTGSAVERDGLIITANDSSVAMPFARAIVTALKTNQLKPDKTPTK
jgi:SagB-type dehydrogenase family enzyme